MAARWRIFHTPICAELELTKIIVHAAAILHNFLVIKKEANVTGDSIDSNGQIQPGNWRDTSTENMLNVRHQGSNNFSLQANEVRNAFRDYFNSEIGSVEWQTKRALNL
jgi:hypothetical protein